MMLEDNIHAVLDTLGDFIKEGKIKHIGYLKTPWGMEESKHHNLPRIKTVQNPYSLLNRLYETGSRNWLSRTWIASLFSNGFVCLSKF
jgi:aryl-alcohol dehydrogenase-like predicted oxidoreductase